MESPHRVPRNFVTQKPYRDTNVLLLLAMSYESPFWLALRQANQLGGGVPKGENSCPVVFWKQTTRDDRESGEPQKMRLLRVYHGFNAAQCDGLKNATEPVESPINTLTRPAEIVAHLSPPPLIRYGLIRAYYSPVEDCVGLPARERFEREEQYFSTLDHERGGGRQPGQRRGTHSRHADFVRLSPRQRDEVRVDQRER